MPLANNNYVTPAWIDNAAPPINDDELNAMSQTLEGSQILVGNGAPTSATPGKIGQRYADMSTTPPTIYKVTNKAFDGQPIPKLQTKAELKTDGYLAAVYGAQNREIRVGSDNDHEITVVGIEGFGYIVLLVACPTAGATAYYTFPDWQGDTWSVPLNRYDSQYGLYYTSSGFSSVPQTYTFEAPSYQSADEALEACANQPAVWQQETDPNKNLAQEYSTGGNYAAGDYCIHEGILFKALEAVNGGAWDGTKWEEVKLADELRTHEEDRNNPHEVTAAQTGALSGSVIATVQTTTTAVRNYAAGDYFLYQGELYVVKEAVAQGTDVFAERTPDEVSVYDMETAYPASVYDSASANASILTTGCDMVCERRSNQALSQVIPSSTRYFFRQTEGNVVAVMYSPEWDDMNDATYSLRIYPRDGTAATGSYIFVYRRAKRAGNLYYCTDPFQPNISWWARADDAVMFTGTDAELEQFIAGIPNKKKSEPAVLGDGVTALYPRTGTISLSASWSGSGPYSQTVTVSGTTVTAKSMVDLLLTAAQLAQLAADEVSGVGIVNNNGALTAYALGAQPSVSMTVGCRVKETV